VTWLQVALAAGITLLLLLAVLRLLVTMSPRPVVITFRSIALLAFLPVLLAAYAALAAGRWLLLAAFVASGIFLATVAGTSAVLQLAALLAAVVAMRLLWVRGPFRGPFKVLLEVCRYMGGEPGYRERVQQALDRAIAQARTRVGSGPDLVLAAQGVGGLMAVDSVLHSGAWRRTDRVLLITMGSPLRRWILSLYPGTLFPESMAGVMDIAFRRLAQLRWVNIYRPWDYLGGGMGLARFGGKDVSTGVGMRRIIGHVDYWRDPDARLALSHGLRRLGQVEPPRGSGGTAAYQGRVSGGPAQRSRERRRRLENAAVLATFLWTLWWVATGTGVLAAGREDRSLLLEQTGLVADASVTHRRTAVERDRGPTYMDYWVFSFTDRRGMDRRVSIQRDASDPYVGVPAPRFDTRALTREVRAGCNGSAAALRWPMGNMTAPCTLKPVRMRYQPADASLFDLPDFPQHLFGSDPLLAWAETAIIAGVLSLVILLPLAAGIRVFDLFQG
jgi:hypothetical protein